MSDHRGTGAVAAICDVCNAKVRYDRSEIWRPRDLKRPDVDDCIIILRRRQTPIKKCTQPSSTIKTLDEFYFTLGLY